MKRSLARLFTIMALAVSLVGVVCNAQQSSNDDSKRKVKVRVNPRYPEIARNMSISGKVKIEVVIAADGRVKSANAIGGHPLLVQACLEVIKDWKYEPAASETTHIVEFEFTPPH
jgi:TonB family protein